MPSIFLILQKYKFPWSIENLVRISRLAVEICRDQFASKDHLNPYSLRVTQNIQNLVRTPTWTHLYTFVKTQFNSVITRFSLDSGLAVPWRRASEHTPALRACHRHLHAMPQTGSDGAPVFPRKSSTRVEAPHLPRDDFFQQGFHGISCCCIAAHRRRLLGTRAKSF